MAVDATTQHLATGDARFVETNGALTAFLVETDLQVNQAATILIQGRAYVDIWSKLTPTQQGQMAALWTICKNQSALNITAST